MSQGGAVGVTLLPWDQGLAGLAKPGRPVGAGQGIPQLGWGTLRRVCSSLPSS